MAGITSPDIEPATFREQGFAGRFLACLTIGSLPAAAHRGGHAHRGATAAPGPIPGRLLPVARGSRDAGEGGHDHGLLRFYRARGIGELAATLLRPDLPPQRAGVRAARRDDPAWPHRPGGPHVDGISPPLPDGTPGTFSLLAGAWLTDHSEPDHGNLWVWPGTHLRFGAYLAEHGADALSRLHPEAYPPIELGEPQQVTGPAGSVLFAHYLLGHNIGGHDGPASAPARQVVYYRLQAAGHRDRWRAAVTDPLSEFRAG